MRPIRRFVVYMAVTTIVLVGLANLLPGFRITTPQGAVFGITVAALLNTFIRPFLVRLTLPLTIVTFGMFSFVLTGVMIWLAGWIVPGFEVAGIFTAILISIGLAASHSLINTFLGRAELQQTMFDSIRRFAARANLDEDEKKTPGLIVLEVDGLSYPVLQRALSEERMPTLKSLLERGSHTVIEWDASLPTQTSAMQAGILHGSHHNIPAFRFYDKSNQRLLVSNHPRDADDVLRPNDNGQGLLKHGGFSINNWAHGNATESVLTFTDMDRPTGALLAQANTLYGFFANTYLFQQTLGSMLTDMWTEVREAWYQQRHDIRPRVDRSFPYPIVRAGTVVLLPMLSVYLLVQKMFEGVNIAYTTLVNYDEVAHHSGVERPDALKILEHIDDHVRWIIEAARSAPRPYEFVLLSDHGQSQGATFRQRTGHTLEELINSLVDREYAAASTGTSEEGRDTLNILLAQLAGADNRRARILRRAVDRRNERGFVDLGERMTSAQRRTAQARTVVCVSGNLAQVYFKDWDHRMSLEEVVACFPALLSGLLDNPYIGFIMCHSEEAGPMVLGRYGTYYLNPDSFEGQNPLEFFGPHAAAHLRELTSYDNCGDVVINSFYDPFADEVAAFEELVGSHGGLGGDQTRPFMLFPVSFEPDGLEELVGAVSVHRAIKRWREKLQPVEVRREVSASSH